MPFRRQKPKSITDILGSDHKKSEKPLNPKFKREVEEDAMHARRWKGTGIESGTYNVQMKNPAAGREQIVRKETPPGMLKAFGRGVVKFFRR